MCSVNQFSVLWSGRYFKTLTTSCFILFLTPLAQAGSHDKPSLSAWPSHVVPQGQYVELRCDFYNESYIFRLHKEHGDPNQQVHEGVFQRKLVLGPVTAAYGGIYRCDDFKSQYPNELTAYSDPLKIIISDIYRKPFLLALQAPQVKLGEKATLQCHSKIMFDTFTLMSHRKRIIKDSYQLTAEFHLGGSHANFSIGPVTPEHAGIYTCYGSFHQTPYEWSESSDPIDINITGLYKKPSLSALMCPVVMSGENMILSCTSDHQFEMFHLSREGVPQGHGIPAVVSHNGISKAIFLLDPVIKKGTYRCYGSFRNFSHVWSSPSDPLYIPVTGNCTLSREPDSKTNNHRIMNMLIGLSVTMILVFSVILLYSCCSTKRSKSQNKDNECHLNSVRKQNQRNTANLNEESEMRTILNRQDPERQEVQEVEYLEFEPMIFKQQLTTSISQITKEFSTDPSVYMDVRKY
ncbi:killer cell immunoglobulin-like receptor 3DL1 [Microtus oregoni]|uniref:killer cell immunoglobulin-like receptor 3DL1 n=1 Tax=Microtus oregoni TaxID=111838 RepID=UPI001BB160C3|nr:killer cell immunoglobulin-like receptor 3DL1 [Microtus oregoni]